MNIVWDFCLKMTMYVLLCVSNCIYLNISIYVGEYTAIYDLIHNNCISYFIKVSTVKENELLL